MDLFNCLILPAIWIKSIPESYPTVICDLEALVELGPLGPIQKLISGGYDNTMKVWKLYNGMGKIDCPSCRVQVRSSCMILSRMKNIGMLNDWSNMHNILSIWLIIKDMPF